ncbi:MAG: aminomethyl-transferring glycine dehydrogenase subunit GcvPB [Candidatus Thermoplasmatota archaeon]
MYRSVRYDEPLINELDDKPKAEFKPDSDIPASLRKKQNISLPDLEENQVVRHYLRLSQMNYGVDTGIYPLGSCTMKYNPKLCDRISAWEQFTATHPCQNQETIQGNLQLMYELEKMLCEITGMDAMTLQPAAGAHGEFTGLLIAKAYHEYHKDFARDQIILPDTAHGTNPASAAMAGYQIVEIPSTPEGTVDLTALKKTLSHRTAVFMLTNPNTLGIFEHDILDIAKLVHDAGALLYYDGANMNAIMGKARPGDMGFDIVHVNLHKTFATPHGGGGPGAGPVGVKKKLERFLPVPRIILEHTQYHLDYDYPQSIGKIRSFYGNFSVLVRAYVYITMMGADGLKEASEIAVLNANYMKEKILESGKYSLPGKNLRKHEFVLSCEKLLQEKGIRALDIAKRLLDYGLHPPTIYFPLLVKEALMIEPTETESKKTLDQYIDVLRIIADEDPALLHQAPQNTSVKRIDETKAVKDSILNWKMLQRKQEEKILLQKADTIK